VVLGAARGLGHRLGPRAAACGAHGLRARFPRSRRRRGSLQGPSADADALTQKIGAKVASATASAISAPTRQSVRARLEWLMHDASVVTDELVEARYRIYADPAFMAISDRMVGELTGGGAWTLTRERLAAIACPALVLWTRQNPTMPWEVGYEASRIIPGASWYLMEDAGHWPQFEKPAEFNGVLLNFLRRL